MAAAAGPLPVRRPVPGPRALLEKTLNVQRAFMDIYGDQLEHLLSVLVYMVPVQEAEDDVAGFRSQVMYSVIDFFQLYRTVLLRRPGALPVAGGQLRRVVYTLAAFSLRALRSVQVLVEMHVVRTRSQQESLRACMLVECVKLVLKLVLRAQMPFALYIDEDALEEVEPPRLGSGLPKAPPPLVPPTDSSGGGGGGGAAGAGRSSAGASASSSSAAAAGAGGEASVGRRTGRALFAGAVGSDLARDATQGRLPRVIVAEALYHGRPLVQLLLLLRRGERSWSSWWAALGLDWLSLALLLPQLKPRPRTRAAALELAEVARRRRLLGWALLRSPLFDWWLRRPCQVLDRLWQKIPVLNVFNLLELFLALQPFYFSTSGT